MALAGRMPNLSPESSCAARCLVRSIAVASAFASWSPYLRSLFESLDTARNSLLFLLTRSLLHGVLGGMGRELSAGIARTIKAPAPLVNNFLGPAVILPRSALGSFPKSGSRPPALASPTGTCPREAAMFDTQGVLKIRPLSDEEIAAVLAEGLRYGQRWKTGKAYDKTMWPVIFGLLCEFGPRVSEPYWLRRGDVDLMKGTVAMTTLKRWRTVEDNAGVQYSVRVPRKRLLPLRPWLAKLFRAHLKAIPHTQDRLFPESDGHTWRCRIWRAWKIVCSRAGVGDYRVHDARHTVGTRLAERDLILARHVLDHASLATTSIYVHCRNVTQRFMNAPGALA